MFAVHSFSEALYVFLGSFTIGVGLSVGHWLVGKVLR